MDFELPEELRLLKDNLRKFVDKELIPLEREVVNDIKLQKELPKKLRPKVDELGLWQYDVPEEFGGLGLGMMAKVIVWSEISRTTSLPSRSLSIFGFPVSPILYTLEGRARDEYLLPVISGEKTSCFAQTEADAGSDPAAMRTNAVRDGDDYVINGVKRFITGADEADFAQVFAVTDTEKRARGGITGLPGRHEHAGPEGRRLLRPHGRRQALRDRVRQCPRAGLEAYRPGRRRLQACAILAQLRAHPPRRALARRHGALLRAWLGLRQAAQDLRRAARRPAVGAMAADRNLHGHAQASLMLYHAAWKYDRGEDCREEAFMAKIFGDERSFWAADRVMQIHGGMGLSKELPIERFFRDQRSMMITEGAVEVLRMALARMILKIR